MTMARKFSWIPVFLALVLIFGCGKQNPASSKSEAGTLDTSNKTSTTENPVAAAGELKSAAQQAVKAVGSSLSFTLNDHAGKEVRLSDYAGKIVVLEWINPECPFVQAHYKVGTMVDLAKKYADQGVVWLGINSTKTATVASNKAFVEGYSLPYPVLDDHQGTVGRLFGAKTTPHMFVLDTHGKVAYQGAIDNAPMGKTQGEAVKVNYVDQAVQELLKGVAVSIAKTEPYGCSVKY